MNALFRHKHLSLLDNQHTQSRAWYQKPTPSPPKNRHHTSYIPYSNFSTPNLFLKTTHKNHTKTHFSTTLFHRLLKNRITKLFLHPLKRLQNYIKMISKRITNHPTTLTKTTHNPLNPPHYLKTNPLHPRKPLLHPQKPTLSASRGYFNPFVTNL